MTVHVFYRDGVSEFDCQDCGVHVFNYGEAPSEPVCLTCRWISEHPQITEETKRLLRGDRDGKGERADGEH